MITAKAEEMQNVCAWSRKGEDGGFQEIGSQYYGKKGPGITSSPVRKSELALKEN